MKTYRVTTEVVVEVEAESPDAAAGRVLQDFADEVVGEAGDGKRVLTGFPTLVTDQGVVVWRSSVR